MPTPSEKNEWKKSAEARIKERAKEREAAIGRDELANEIRLEKAAAQHELEMKTKAERAFVASGGSPAMFIKSWPEIRGRMLIDETMRRLNLPRSSNDPVSRL